MSDYTFLSIGDAHLGKTLYNIYELGEDLKKQYVRAVEKAVELQVTYFVSCGDLFDTNKPSADLIEFVRELNHKLRTHHICPIALSGDHSIGNDNITWEHLCDFDSFHPTDFPMFAGADYQIDQEKVAESILSQLSDKTEFIFLHGQEPLLFPFCDEKKKFVFDWEMLFDDYDNLKGVILGDFHSPVYKYINGKFIGYCGSLGVTKKDEFDSKVIYYDGNKLKYLPLPLHRTFKEFIVDKDTKYSDILSFIEQRQEKPVIILMSTRENSCYVNELLKLKEKAFVITDVIREEKNDNVRSTIRSEINLDGSVNKVIEQILTENGTNTPINLALAQELIEGVKVGAVKTVLNNFIRNRNK